MGESFWQGSRSVAVLCAGKEPPRMPPNKCTLMSPPINPWLELTSLFPLFPLMKILMGFWGTAGGGAGASASPISEKAKRPYSYSRFVIKTGRHRGLESW